MSQGIECTVGQVIVPPVGLLRQDALCAGSENVFTNDVDYVKRCWLAPNLNTANASSEGHWKQVLIIIFRMLGFPSEVELHTKAGRIDIELKSGSTVYVIEIKTNKTASAAMRQIDEKAYAAKYSLSQVQVVKVGINFDAAEHTISEWQIQST